MKVSMMRVRKSSVTSLLSRYCVMTASICSFSDGSSELHQMRM